jgi:hypothetical protein
MSSLVRSAKSLDKWTIVDLDAYNITICHKEFPNWDLNIPKGISSEFLEYNFLSRNLVAYPDKLIRYIEMILSSQESVINDLAREMLIATGYECSNRIIKTEYTIPFVVSGEHRDVHIDTSISKTSGEILLILNKNRDVHEGINPESQIIAKAIAVFHENNRIRNEKGARAISSMDIPCITMAKGFPRFYVVPVSEDLNKCVQRSQYPTRNTPVLAYIPQIQEKSIRGWMDPENRKTILGHYEKLKKYVDQLDRRVSEAYPPF